MRALLDVNVLIALLDADHSLHGEAMHWFADHARTGWASTPITENGCVRIMSHAGYPNAQPVSQIVTRLRSAAADAVHEFWPDNLSLLDARRFDATRIHGSRQLTDLYLLALAVDHDARFVTFDAAVSPGAVRGAEQRHLLKL